MTWEYDHDVTPFVQQPKGLFEQATPMTRFNEADIESWFEPTSKPKNEVVAFAEPEVPATVEPSLPTNVIAPQTDEAQVQQQVAINKALIPMLQSPVTFNEFIGRAAELATQTEDKEVLVNNEPLVKAMTMATDTYGRPIFSTREKARDFLRLIAYPNRQTHYTVPKSLYRAINQMQPMKFSPLMKRELQSMSKY